MSAYLRLRNRAERLLFDTAKAKLRYEEQTFDLTGGALDIYDGQWQIEPTEIGKEITQPGRLLIVRDPFTGFGVHLPLTYEQADLIALGLLDQPTQARRYQKIKKLLGR